MLSLGGMRRLSTNLQVEEEVEGVRQQCRQKRRAHMESTVAHMFTCSHSHAAAPTPPWSKPLHNGFGAAAVHPDFNFERSCSLVFQQEFRVQHSNATLRDRLGV